MTNENLRLAITGATGFIGRQLLKDCTQAGISVSALTRQPVAKQSQVDTPSIRWVRGDLSKLDALADLVHDVDCVIHLAGATKGLSDNDFHATNTVATDQLAQLCIQKKVGHFLFLSSLAATRPSVSPYAASKAAAETALIELRPQIDVTLLRAPAVLGPDDTATHALFSNLAKGIMPVPGGKAGEARFSIIDVLDLTALLLSLAQTRQPFVEPIAPYGHQSLGWQDMAQSAARVTKRRVRQITLPAPIMSMVAKTTDIIAKLRGKPQVFSSDKLSEMNAGDWIATSPVDNPVTLDDTLRRCLEPFQKQPNRPV